MATVRKFDVTTPRPKYGATRGEVWWHRIGNAVENDKGQLTIWLDSLPLTGEEGKAVLNLFEKREEDARATTNHNSTRTKPKASKDADDEIPF